METSCYIEIKSFRQCTDHPAFTHSLTLYLFPLRLNSLWFLFFSHLNSIFDEIFNDFRNGKPISNLSKKETKRDKWTLHLHKILGKYIFSTEWEAPDAISIRPNFWFINENTAKLRELIQLKTVSTALISVLMLMFTLENASGPF